MLEVHTVEGLTKTKLDILQQNISEIEISWCAMPKNPPVGILYVDNDGVGLTTEIGQNDLRFSWDENLKQWQREGRSALRNNSLIKALGKKERGTVVDATVGLGKDTSLLLAFGHSVLGFERNPKVYFLLKASQILENFMPDKLFLHFGVATEAEIEGDIPIYFDPMFDDGKKRKAKPNKGMALFHEIVGGDSDAFDMAQKLREKTNRLVIKRAPRDKQVLENRNSFWESKAVRFDLYL